MTAVITKQDEMHNLEATSVCRLVRLQSVCFEHCTLWLVISIRCSVIVLIGLLFREFFFVYFWTNTVKACTINSDK